MSHAPESFSCGVLHGQNKAQICLHPKRRSKPPARRNNRLTVDNAADVAVASAKPGRIEYPQVRSRRSVSDELVYELEQTARLFKILWCNSHLVRRRAMLCGLKQTWRSKWTMTARAGSCNLANSVLTIMRLNLFGATTAMLGSYGNPCNYHFRLFAKVHMRACSRMCGCQTCNRRS